MRISSIITLLALGCFGILCWVPPFPLRIFFLLLSLTIFFMALVAVVRSAALKYIYIFAFTLCIPLLIAEGDYYRIIKRDQGIHVQRGGVFAQGLAQPDPAIGYVGTPKASVPSRMVRDGVEIYNVTYNLDEKGRRVTPEAPEADTAIVLFGCSFTLGEGLEDRQTLAWQLGEALGPRYKVLNYGLSGYGTHHMQALIERGLPELAPYKKIHAYHLAISGHQRRVAGVSPWDRNGPRYALENGKAVRRGTFAENPPFFWEGQSFEPLLEQSYFFKGIKQILSEKLVPLDTFEKRVALTRALISTSAETFKSQWPQASFSVLAWPPDSTKILQGLSPAVPVLDVQAWLPGYSDNPRQYMIPGDSHPNAGANALAAKKLAESIRAKDAGR